MEKRSWYDGWFYAQLIDRQKSRLRRRVTKAIPVGQSTIDIGCGTGGLCLDIAESAIQVLGIDISAQQINVANKRSSKSIYQNITFKQADAKNLKGIVEANFDIAIIVLMIHEVLPDDRLTILKEVKKYATRILIFDYSEKISFNFWGVGTYLIEFFAGREHFNNFKIYLKNGGILPLLDEAGYKIEHTRIDRSGIFRFVTSKK